MKYKHWIQFIIRQIIRRLIWKMLIIIVITSIIISIPFANVTFALSDYTYNLSQLDKIYIYHNAFYQAHYSDNISTGRTLDTDAGNNNNISGSITVSITDNTANSTNSYTGIFTSTASGNNNHGEGFTLYNWSGEVINYTFVSGHQYTISMSGQEVFDYTSQNGHDGALHSTYNLSSNSVSFTYNGQDGWQSLTPAFTPTISGQLNSYDCLTNTGVFALSSNFNLKNVTVDGLDTADDKSKILSSSFDNSTWNLTVVFSNTINENTTQHTLFITGTGTNPNDGSNVTASTTIDFDISQCSETPPVQKGQFKIVFPEDGQKFDSGITSIEVKCAYGGNIETDYGTGTTLNIGITYQLSNVGSTTLTNYTIDNNITYWDTTITLSNNSDGTYTAEAMLFDNNNHLIGSDQISFTIGNGGNPLIDFLKNLWKEFKQWFVDTMKYLFVPTDSEMNELVQDVQNLNLKNYIPVLDLSGNQTDCLTLYNGSFDILGTQSGNINWQICLSDVPDNIWNIIKITTDLFITMLLLFLIIKALGT